METVTVLTSLAFGSISVTHVYVPENDRSMEARDNTESSATVRPEGSSHDWLPLRTMKGLAVITLLHVRRSVLIIDRSTWFTI